MLAEQNRAWGAPPEVLDLVDTLRQSDAVAVVTGQQLGLFAGPLYTVWKARSALRLAERLACETGRTVVPVFWLADEDHDFAEVQRAAFAHDGAVRHAAYNDGRRSDADRGPVGRIVLDADAVRQSLAGAGGGAARRPAPRRGAGTGSRCVPAWPDDARRVRAAAPSRWCPTSS